jgi:hypothetical protein
LTSNNTNINLNARKNYGRSGDISQVSPTTTAKQSLIATVREEPRTMTAPDSYGSFVTCTGHKSIGSHGNEAPINQQEREEKRRTGPGTTKARARAALTRPPAHGTVNAFDHCRVGVEEAWQDASCFFAENNDNNQPPAICYLNIMFLRRLGNGPATRRCEDDDCEKKTIVEEDDCGMPVTPKSLWRNARLWFLPSAAPLRCQPTRIGRLKHIRRRKTNAWDNMAETWNDIFVVLIFIRRFRDFATLFDNKPTNHWRLAPYYSNIRLAFETATTTGKNNDTRRPAIKQQQRPLTLTTNHNNKTTSTSIRYWYCYSLLGIGIDNSRNNKNNNNKNNNNNNNNNKTKFCTRSM